MGQPPEEHELDTHPNDTPEQLGAICLSGADALDAEAEQAADPDDRACKHAAARQVRRYAAALVTGPNTVPAAEARLVADAAHSSGVLGNAALMTAPLEIRRAADALLASGVLTPVIEHGLVQYLALAAYAAHPDHRSEKG
jgi:hypothetical protein